MLVPEARPTRHRAIWLVAFLLGALASWLLWGGQREEPPLRGVTPPTTRTAESWPGPMLEGHARPASPPAQPPAPTAPPDPDVSPTAPSYAIEGVVRDLATRQVLPDLRVVGRWHSFDPQTNRADLQEIEATARPDGGFRIDVIGGHLPVVSEFGLREAAWQLLAWEREGGEAAAGLDTAPGARNEVTLWARRAFRLRGVVQDAQGRPLPHAYANFIVASVHGARATFGNTLVNLGRDGTFDIGPFAHDPALGLPSPGVLRTSPSFQQVFFRHDGMSQVVLEPLTVPVEERERLVITLTTGIALAGIVVDERGQALADVPVAVEYASSWELRRGARTDAAGRWRIERLTPGPAVLQARAFAYDAKAKRELTLTQDDLDVRLVAEPIRLSRIPATTQVLGLSLAEVDDELRRAYEVPAQVHVLILDPGAEPEKLGIGRLEKGYGLWMVGTTKVTSLKEALDRLIDPATSKEESVPDARRVVYTFWDQQMAGNNTQHLRLSPEQLEELKALRERLGR